MADITVVNDTGELYNVINQKKSEGYLESELTIISKSKLHLNDLRPESPLSQQVEHLVIK